MCRLVIDNYISFDNGNYINYGYIITRIKKAALNINCGLNHS